MRSSNSNQNQLKHARTNSSARAEKSKRIPKFASIVITALVLFAAVIIPGVTLIQHVGAVTEVKPNVLNIGGVKVYSGSIVNVKETEPSKPVEKEKKKASKVKAIMACEKVDESYKPKHISLSSYDRAKLERLVMGEAGGMGFKGSALVAQTIRDTMQFEKNNSIDYIINAYKYEGSTKKQPTSAVKKAVSYIFDKDGYAVQHRLIYFYASDLIKSEWHETQNYIVSCGSERFFDRRG